MQSAILNGHLDVVQFLYAHAHINDVEMDVGLSLSCITGHLHIATWIYSLGINITSNTTDPLFIMVCMRGYFEIAKWLRSIGANIHNDNSSAFVQSCTHGHIKIAKWLFLLGADIHADNDTAFTNSCKYGKLEVAKWLYSHNPDIYANNHSAFKESCDNGHLEVAKWLCSIEPKYKILDRQINEGNIKILYEIINPLKELYEARRYDQIIDALELQRNDMCIICYDTKQYMVRTKCTHILCLDCMYYLVYVNNHTLCPYCRQKMHCVEYSINEQSIANESIKTEIATN
jgi:hypothetical protein